jgi:DNA adenine methylase
MKPIIKYQGGKSKELPFIKCILPNKYDRIIEPFCGGGAVSFGMEVPAHLNDINHDVINLYRVISDKNLYPDVQAWIDQYKQLEHDDLEKLYYKSRETINQPWQSVTDLDNRAISYIIVRQLCFSGMERYNSKGEFNVPFGHYKKLSCNLSMQHHTFLRQYCTTSYGSFEQCFDGLTENDFVFVDPPYLDRLGYTKGDGGLKLHQDLLGCLKTTSAKWMIVHCDNDFYRDEYKDYNTIVKDFKYSQNFVGRDNSGNKVNHLYITNYNIASPLDNLVPFDVECSST